MSTDLYGVRVLALAPQQQRVRFRVFVVSYDVDHQERHPLPDDPSFFFRVLWEAGGSWQRRYGPLHDLVTQEQSLDEGWVDAHTRHFVADAVRVASRNHPPSADDYQHLADFSHEHDGRWEDEDQLVQADYDVHVTDARWLAPLRVGQSWGTTAYATTADRTPGDEEAGSYLDLLEASAAGHARAATSGASAVAGPAAFHLAALRQERDESVDAVEAYLRAIDIGEDDVKARALTKLGELYTKRGDTDAARTPRTSGPSRWAMPTTARARR